MAVDFEDDARLLLNNWDAFREILLGADEAAAKLEAMDILDYDKIELTNAVSLADYLENDLTALYPLVACLTEGQRAGMKFLSLQELVMLTNRAMEYDPDELADITAISFSYPRKARK